MGGEALGPTAVIPVTRPRRGRRDIISALDLGPAVLTPIPSGEGGWADLQPTAQGHGSEGPKSWLERRLTPAWTREAEMFAQLQRRAHRSFLAHEEERHWPGWGPAWASLSSRAAPPPSPPLPEMSPLRSEVRDYDSFSFFFSSQRHLTLSSFPRTTKTDLYFYF